MAYLNESEEVRNLRNAFCKLIEHGGCPAMCKIKQWAVLKNAVIFEAFAKAGMQVPAAVVEPFGLRPVRELIREIRRAYGAWDQGRLSQREFNEQASRISDEFELRERLGYVGDAEGDKFHDEYESSMIAANDVAEF